MGKLYAGAAKICIDPSEDMFPFTPFWGVAKEGVYASMYVRALALRNEDITFVIIVSEFGNGSRELPDRASEKYGIPKENLIFTNIHNHAGPYMGGPGGPDDPRFAYNKFYDDQVMTVIGEALDALRPARLGYGEGKSYINVNRDLQLEDGSWSQADNYEGPSDKTLAVIKIEDMDGKLIAAMLNHCTHANLTFLCRDEDGKSKTCGDFPGFCCDYLEKRYGGDAVFLWTSGAAGDQNAIPCFRGEPHYTGEDLTNFCAPYGLGYKYSQYVGEYHAHDALKVLKEIVCDEYEAELKCTSTMIEFDGQKLPEGVDDKLQTLKAQNSVKIVEQLYPDLVKDGRIIDRTLVEPVPTGEKIPSEMRLICIGDIAIVTSEAELYNEIGTLLKENSPSAKTVIVTHVAGPGHKVGYVQDDSSAAHPVFQHFGEIVQGRNNEILLDGESRLFEQIDE